MSAPPKQILLTDMSLCRPADALSHTAKLGHWQLVSYSASGAVSAATRTIRSRSEALPAARSTDPFSGTMLLAAQETGAPEVTLPLDARGWYAIHLGFTGWSWSGQPLLKVRLSGDPCFTEVASEPGLDHRYLEEGFWKIADLDGQDLVIAQRTSAELRSANLAFVRLVPLSPDEVKRRMERTGTRRLIAMHDGTSFYAHKGGCSVRDIQAEIEPFRDTDFSGISWETWGGDKSNYPARVGALLGQHARDFVDPGTRRIVAGMREMKERGVHPLEVALKHAHRIGLEFYAGMRMGFFGMHPPGEVWEGPFLREHPEFRCRDRDGTEVSHISYAFPQVREYVLSLLGDSAGYDIDGVNLIFLRGQPYVLYEELLVEGFRRETGVDPARLGDDDPRWRWYEQEAVPTFLFGDRTAMDQIAKQRCMRLSELSSPVQKWLRWRAQALTTFLRALRERLDGTGKKRKLCSVVFANEADNLFFGLDVETWVGEGLVDLLIPYPWPEHCGIDTAFFQRIAADSPCGIYPNVMPRQQAAGEYLAKAMHYYESGADGLAFWDADGRHPLLSQWQAVRELGHRQELGEWLKSGRFSGRFLQLKRLGGYTVDRYHPDSGG